LVVNVNNLTGLMELCPPGSVRGVFLNKGIRWEGESPAKKAHILQVTAEDPQGRVVRLYYEVGVWWSGDEPWAPSEASKRKGEKRVEAFDRVCAIVTVFLHEHYRVHDGELAVHKDIRPAQGDFECCKVVDGEVKRDDDFFETMKEKYDVKLL